MDLVKTISQILVFDIIMNFHEYIHSFKQKNDKKYTKSSKTSICVYFLSFFFGFWLLFPGKNLFQPNYQVLLALKSLAVSN